ncbi:DUF4178 domain-containing protein, partial [bacterium]|nr:DUF4178 domain-containing protein [bacterium]
CPSCGAPVRLQAASSVSAVCGYCGTTVARDDALGQNAVKDLGKISSLVEDASPLCLGARGEAFGRKFEVVGRLQLEQETGVWNEWFLHFQDKGAGWIGEALGQYFVTTDGNPAQVLHFEELKPGQKLFIGNGQWTVGEVRVGRCTGGEGELPFVAGSGYELPYADLRAPGNRFATLDYSEEPPLLFTGKAHSWDELHMTNHRRFRGWS